MSEHWYRYDGTTYASLDEFDDVCEGRTVITLDKIPVLKHTPKGVWLEMSFDEKRFVLRDARKRYACPTKREALESLVARKRRQISILETQTRRAKLVLALAERQLQEMES